MAWRVAAVGGSATVAVVLALRHRAHEPTPTSICLDYNYSCVTPCKRCQQLARAGCVWCARAPPSCHSSSLNSSMDVNRRRPVRWLHVPKCGATLAVSVLSYACADMLPSWHIAGMALRGGRIDVRMARAIRARHGTRGERCGGRLRLPFDGHHPVSARDVEHGGLVGFFRRPAQRLISACACIANPNPYPNPNGSSPHVCASFPAHDAACAFPICLCVLLLRLACALRPRQLPRLGAGGPRSAAFEAGCTDHRRVCTLPWHRGLRNQDARGVPVRGARRSARWPCP